MRCDYCLLPFAAVLVLAGHSLFAAEWPPLDEARKSSMRDDKPMLALVISTGPHRQDVNYPRVRDKAAKDEDTKGFVLCTLNLYEAYTPTAAETAGGHLPYRKNVTLEAIYGGVGAICVLAPGAARPLWSLAGASKDDVFKQAREAHTAWFKPIEDAHKEMKEKRDLRKDPGAVAKLAGFWAAGYASPQALKLFDEAIKLLPRNELAGVRAEEWTLLAAGTALDSMDWGVAAKRYKDFLDSFKESRQRDAAHLARAKALLGLNDKEGALKELEAISAEAPQVIRNEAAKVREQASVVAAK